METWIFFGIFFAVLAVIVGQAIRRGLQLKTLSQSGMPAKGTVVKKERIRRKKGSTPTLTYEFHDMFGQTHRRRDNVSESIFNQHEEGSGIDVVYLPDRPKVHGLKYMVEEVRKAMAKHGNPNLH